MEPRSYDILAIDDDEDTIEGLLSEFDLLGFSYELARTIEQAKEKLRNIKYKMLLVDLRMTLSDNNEIADDGGLELIRLLRKGKLGAINRDTQYILVSAQEFLIERMEAKIPPEELQHMRVGQIMRFSKGDSLTPLVHRASAALDSISKVD